MLQGNLLTWGLRTTQYIKPFLSPQATDKKVSQLLDWVHDFYIPASFTDKEVF